MRKILKPSLIALSISSLFVPLCAHSAPVPNIVGDTITWLGDNSPYNDVLIEKSSAPGGSGRHEMIIQNVNLISFTSSTAYSGMYYKAAVSLAGGNGLLSGSTLDYGNLSLKAIGSSITGSIASGQLTGLYARSDTAGATVNIESNSLTDLSYSNSGSIVLGILAETKGVGSLATVKLQNGANITIANNSGGSSYNGSAAVLAYSEQGKASIVTEAGSVVTTSGYGVDGIRTYSQEGSSVNNQGTITLSGDASSAILAFNVAGGAVGAGIVNVTNAASGILSVNGANSNGINAFNAGNDGINILNEGTITLGSAATASSGIVAQNASPTGDIYVENNGSIAVGSTNSYAINVLGSTGTGTATAINKNVISINGANSSAIRIHNSASGTASAINQGTIELDTAAANSNAILVENTASGGDVYAENTGTITVNSSTSTAINAVALGDGKVKVINTGSITNIDGTAIYARSAYGSKTEVYASGNITTGQPLSMSASHGIYAAADFGDTTIQYDAGAVKVSGNNSIGIVAADGNTGNHWIKNNITLGSTAIIDATQGLGGLLLQANGGGVISIAQGAEVHGGGNSGYAIKFDGEANSSSSPLYTDYKLHNDGFIDAMSDWAIVSDSVAGTTLEINNNGSIYGYLTLGSENTTFNNFSSQSWNIRHFADTDGDLVRDTKGIAITDFGAGNDTFNNSGGAIRLSAVSGENNYNTTGQYSTLGSLSILNSGSVQGQLLNLNTFKNGGLIDLSENQQAGDILVISGNANMSGSSIYEGGTITSGGGQFISDGGLLVLDTVLNDGGTNALSDVLVIDDAITGSAATQIIINQVGGTGRITSGDGIQIVNILGNADAGAFTLAGGNALKAGAYEYTLHQGSLSNPANNSLFLRATAQQINPDVGAYLANQTAATGLFMHSLHDRLGEPQFYQDYLEENREIPAFWLRSVASKTKGEAASNSLKQDSDNLVVHLGGELANWSRNGDDRYHLGIMGAYGRSETETKSKATGNKANSTVDGYGVGAYLTWYSNPNAPEGWYTDIWSMYNWFNNEADSSDDYDSKSWTTSLELGYAEQLKAFSDYNWMLEPQGQVAYHYYSVSDIKDKNGMTATNPDADGFSTRLGMRTYLQPSNNQAKFQPFVEVNWLYNNADNSMKFNGETFSSDMPSNRFETKIGVQAKATKNTHFYSHIGTQFGKDSYKHYEGQIGLKYRF